MPLSKPLFALLIVIVTATVATSLYMSGSPLKARAERFDTQRINDLEQIRNALDQYWMNAARLPDSLETLAQQRDPYYFSSLRDPKTGVAYEFKPVTGSNKYELCATFETSVELYPGKSVRPRLESLQEHKAGYQCFALEIRALTRNGM